MMTMLAPMMLMIMTFMITPNSSVPTGDDYDDCNDNYKNNYD